MPEYRIELTGTLKQGITEVTLKGEKRKLPDFPILRQIQSYHENLEDVAKSYDASEFELITIKIINQ
jgi:hypothetical protein